MLAGQNIQLRAMEPSDIERLFQWENDTDNWRFSNTLRPFSRKSIERHVLQSHDIYTEKQLRLMIQLNESDKTIGAIDLYDCDFTHLRAGVGVLIGDPDERRKGYALEALNLLIQYSSEVLMFHQLHAEVLSNNPGSSALFEQAGFEQCGVYNDWVKHPLGFYNLVLFQRRLSDNG